MDWQVTAGVTAYMVAWPTDPAPLIHRRTHPGVLWMKMEADHELLVESQWYI